MIHESCPSRVDTMFHSCTGRDGRQREPLPFLLTTGYHGACSVPQPRVAMIALAELENTCAAVQLPARAER